MALAAVAFAACIASTTVRAQELSAADRAAAQAYDRASAAYLAGQYERAASLFETAYRVLPNATALLQAARAHERAGPPARGATLASRLLARFGDSAEFAEATTLLEALRSGLTWIELAAGGTREWGIDGALQDAEDSIVFVQPGVFNTTQEVGVCSGDPLADLLSTQLTNMLDVRDEPPNPEDPPLPCNALSLGASFRATRIRVAGVVMGPEPPNVCEERMMMGGMGSTP